MSESTRLGLRANWPQFALLVAVNAFVGAMVGLERAVLPVIGRTEFRLATTTAVLSFIAAFGLAKALTNLAAGWLADRRGRRSLLLFGWLLGFPVPLLIGWAPSWSWIVLANALLGVNQGLAWSMAIVMKLDLVGPERRGLATGLNEFAGYLGVAAAGFLSGLLVSRLGPREAIVVPGLVIATAGMLLSLLVRETGAHARLEAEQTGAGESRAERPGVGKLLGRSIWKDPGLASVSQAGFVNNLNDGLAWGGFPLLFAASGLAMREIGLLAALYPFTWGISQLAAGPLSDRWGRKRPIVLGMLLQGLGLLAIAASHRAGAWAAGLITLGLGTALVYPTLLAATSDLAHPAWRGAAVGVYRLWRDLGYVAGALAAGGLADLIGMPGAIAAIGLLTIGSGLMVALRYPERPPLTRAARRLAWKTR